MRRICKWLSMVGAFFLFLPGTANAQNYPSQDIHMVTSFPPGSGADVITRFFAEKMRVVSGRTVIVENKVGANGNIATEYVARAKPDGYTILMTAGSASAAGMHLMKQPPVDVVKAFKIPATICRLAFVVAVDPKSPYTTLPQLTEAMKKKGKDASYGTAAPSGIVTGEMYKSITGLEAVQVLYRDGNSALPDLLTGRLDYVVVDPIFGMAQLSEGKLRVLGHGSATPIKALGDIPPMATVGVPGMDLVAWWAPHVPAATPPDVINKINQLYTQILALPETLEFLKKFGMDPFELKPDEAQALFIKDERAWAEYVKLAKIEPQ